MSLQWNGLDAQLQPAFAQYVNAIIGPLPYTYNVQQGYRSAVQQNAAYSLGRDANGNIIDPSKVVTNARAGESPHNFGLAVDLYPFVGGAVDYGFTGGLPEPSSEAFPAWSALWAAIRGSGELTTGADFQLASGYDPGHVELTDWRLFTTTGTPGEAVAQPMAPVLVTADGTTGISVGGFTITPTTLFALAAVGAVGYMAWQSRRRAHD